MHFALVGMRATTVLQGVRTLSKSPVLTDGSIWMAKRVQSGPEKFAPVAGPRGPGTVARVLAEPGQLVVDASSTPSRVVSRFRSQPAHWQTEAQ